MKLQGKPVTRVENYCATGSEALRQACYAVASRRLRRGDGGRRREGEGRRLPGPQRLPDAHRRHRAARLTAAAMYSLILPAYAQKYGVDEDELRVVVAKIAEKNHYNGARNPLAQFRRETSAEQICQMAAVAGRPQRVRLRRRRRRRRGGHRRAGRGAHGLHRQPAVREGACRSCPATGAVSIDPDYDYTTLPECAMAAEDAYRQAGVTDPPRRARHGRGARLLHPDRAAC